MASKSVHLYACIEPDVNEKTESILSEAELNAELEKGYAAIKAGRTREASAVFANIRKDYNL